MQSGPGLRTRAEDARDWVVRWSSTVEAGKWTEAAFAAGGLAGPDPVQAWGRHRLFQDQRAERPILKLPGPRL